MTQPFFSIVIPTFNRSELFPLAVRSILKQTFEDFEIILSDNYSADPTPEVAKQFTDPRVTYVRTPRHFTIADAWEFARSYAKGQLIIMLSDDDALITTALERFEYESRSNDADFLFCSRAEYRDLSYPGPEKNSVDCPAFSGNSWFISVEDFIRPLFSFRLMFDMHPSAFVFAKAIADHVAHRTGRFFWTNGVEYSAWPIAATFARNIIHIDAPMTILGRTGKSWGANIALCNPGKERIQEFIEDVDHDRKHAPLNNFTMCNLMAEGMLTAKSLFPEEFAAYAFDEIQYLRRTMAELRKREAMGVDVSAEMDETLGYAAKYPSLPENLKRTKNGAWNSSENSTLGRRIRSLVRDLGGGRLRESIRTYQLARKLRHGAARSGFRASGDDFGFQDILECSDFISKHVNSFVRSVASSGGFQNAADANS